MLGEGLFPLAHRQDQLEPLTACGILITRTLFPVKLHVIWSSHMLQLEQGRSPDIRCPGGWLWSKLHISFSSLLLCGCGSSEETAASAKLRAKGQWVCGDCFAVPTAALCWRAVASRKRVKPAYHMAWFCLLHISHNQDWHPNADD